MKYDAHITAYYKDKQRCPVCGRTGAQARAIDHECCLEAGR